MVNWASLTSLVLKLTANSAGAWKSYALDGDIANMSISVGTTFQLVLQEGLKALPGDSIKDMLELKPTLYLENAVALVSLLEWFNGFGKPDKGTVLTDAAKPNFDAALANLKLAAPDELRWSGKASLAYGQLIHELQECIKAVQSTDKDFQSYVKSEAELVFNVRQQFGYTKAALAACIPVAWAIYFYALAAASAENILWIPPLTPQIVALQTTKRWQIAFIVAALGALGVETGIHIDKVASNAAAMQAAVPAKYDAARGALTMPNPSNAAGVRHAVPASGGGSIAPEFRAAGGTIAGTPSGRHSVATDTRAHGDLPAREHALPEAPAAVSSQAAAAGTAPAFTSPVVSHPAPTAVSRPTSHRKETGAAPVTGTESGLGVEVADVGAAAGTAGAERAPIDPAADTAVQAPDASAASR
ncbi:EspA/EspE family type VII secretion system effector [Mycobacterium sp. pR1184]|uniref:EspA/EspE family type VII secretion system effector n=1 Tax=Mycobacterium sp. pR1184 TaxID=3238981 RepID=UPI00351B9CEC